MCESEREGEAGDAEGMHGCHIQQEISVLEAPGVIALQLAHLAC